MYHQHVSPKCLSKMFHQNSGANKMFHQIVFSWFLPAGASMCRSISPSMTSTHLRWSFAAQITTIYASSSQGNTTLYWPAALCSVFKWATWKQNTLELGTNNLGSTELTSQVFAEILKSKLLSRKSQPTHTCDAKITTMTYFLSRESQHTRKWSIFNQMQHRAHHQNYILIIHMQVVGSEGIFGLTLLALAQVRLVLGPIWGKSQYQFIQGRTFWFFLQEL